MVRPLEVVACAAAASVVFLQRRNIAWLLKHGIKTVQSWQKPENRSDDYISKLPDEILASILSLLTIKEAVRTRILSRRWRHVSEYLHVINLDWTVMSGAPDRRDFSGGHVCAACRRYTDESGVCALYFDSFRSNFRRFLNTCKNQKLESFELSVCIEGNQEVRDITDWINFALDRDVDKLSLQFYCVDYSEFGATRQLKISHLSGLSNLKQLRLRSTFVEFDSQPKFSSLVTLHLSHVVFGRDDGVPHILFACPSLEELRLEACALPRKLYVGDNNLHYRLKTMRISHCSGLEHIEVCARSIETFEFLGVRLIRFGFPKACKIQNLLLKTDQGEMDKIFGGHLLAGLPCLRKLTLMVPSFAVRQMPANPWTFHNVKALHLFVWYDVEERFHTGGFLGFLESVRRFFSDRPNLAKFVLSLLKSLPELQKLHVLMPWHNLWWDYTNEEAEWKHEHLKEVEIGSFCGGEVEVTFANYLLRNAVALQHMVLDQSLWRYIGFGNWRRDVRPSPMHALMLALVRMIGLSFLEYEYGSKNAKIIIR